jgi:hypothetical protein
MEEKPEQKLDTVVEEPKTVRRIISLSTTTRMVKVPETLGGVVDDELKKSRVNRFKVSTQNSQEKPRGDNTRGERSPVNTRHSPRRSPPPNPTNRRKRSPSPYKDSRGDNFRGERSPNNRRKSPAKSPEPSGQLVLYTKRPRHSPPRGRYESRSRRPYSYTVTCIFKLFLIIKESEEERLERKRKLLNDYEDEIEHRLKSLKKLNDNVYNMIREFEFRQKENNWNRHMF